MANLNFSPLRHSYSGYRERTTYGGNCGFYFTSYNSTATWPTQGFPLSRTSTQPTLLTEHSYYPAFGEKKPILLHVTMTGCGMTCLFPLACWYCLPSHQSPCCLLRVRAPGLLPITFRSTGYMGLPCTMETLVSDSHWVSKQQDFTFPYKPRPLFV